MICYAMLGRVEVGGRWYISHKTNVDVVNASVVALNARSLQRVRSSLLSQRTCATRETLIRRYLDHVDCDNRSHPQAYKRVLFSSKQSNTLRKSRHK